MASLQDLIDEIPESDLALALSDAVSGVDPLAAGVDPLGGAAGVKSITLQPTAAQKLLKLAAQAKGLQAINKGVEQAEGRARMRRLALTQKQPIIMLGIDSETDLGRDVAANETIVIATESVERMRITDFNVRGANAGDFLIGAILVKRTNLLSGDSPVPADVFASPERPPIESPILPAGTRLSVQVINTVNAARRFTGMFRGVDLDNDVC